MLEASAMMLFRMDALLKGIEVDNDTWYNLTDQEKSYWFMMADGVLTLWETPDDYIINAVLTKMREPSIVKFSNWRDQNRAYFMKIWTTALKAGRNKTW